MWFSINFVLVLQAKDMKSVCEKRNVVVHFWFLTLWCFHTSEWMIFGNEPNVDLLCQWISFMILEYYISITLIFFFTCPFCSYVCYQLDINVFLVFLLSFSASTNLVMNYRRADVITQWHVLKQNKLMANKCWVLFVQAHISPFTKTI